VHNRTKLLPISRQNDLRRRALKRERNKGLGLQRLYERTRKKKKSQALKKERNKGLSGSSACMRLRQRVYQCLHTTIYVSSYYYVCVLMQARAHATMCQCRHTRTAVCGTPQHTSAYVSIRQHTSAYGSIRQHTSADSHCCMWHACAAWSSMMWPKWAGYTSAYVTSAYVSIRAAYVSIRAAYVSIRAAYVQHTSAYVSIRQHTCAASSTMLNVC
jgi:hypothetical protein